MAFNTKVSSSGTRMAGLAIETKLDLPDPTGIVTANSQQIPMDSSLSPRIVKAFYEINFIPVSKPDTSKPFISITNSKGCPYNRELCKYYFTPMKVSTVQKVEEMIDEVKKDSDVPVIDGLTVHDEEKLLKELNSTIMAKLNRKVPLKKNDDAEVPVYKGTVSVDAVLNRPEANTPSQYRPRWHEETRRNPCLQGPCYWRGSYPTSPFSDRI